jgi:zinc protease
MRAKIKVKTVFSFICIFTISIFIDNLLWAIESPINVKDEYSTLDNGLKIVIKKDTKDSLISLTAAYKFGAAYDTKSKDGFAHYTYQVINRMISKIFSDEYKTILNDEGASYLPEFGRDTVTFTTIFMNKNLDTVLKIEALRMSFQSIDPEEFEAVKRILMADFLKGVDSTPAELIKYNLRGAINVYWEYYHAFKGKEEDIQIARIQDIERYAKWYYSPSNAAIVIKGPLNKSEILIKIRDIFSTIPKSKVAPQASSLFSLSRDIISLYFTHPDLETPAISFSYRIPPIVHKDYPANTIIFNLLFAYKESILGKYYEASKLLKNYYTLITDANGPNYMGAVFYLPGSEYNDSMTDLIKESIKNITEGKITETEFNRAKQKALVNNKESLSSINYSKTIASMLLLFPKPADINSYFQSFSSLTKQEIINTAKIYLTEPNSCMVISEK